MALLGTMSVKLQVKWLGKILSHIGTKKKLTSDTERAELREFVALWENASMDFIKAEEFTNYTLIQQLVIALHRYDAFFCLIVP
jgi:hypothetical protein